MWKRVSLLWMLVKGDARRLWFALRHPDAPAWLKAGTVLLLLYLVSPIDLIPDTIPLFGAWSMTWCCCPRPSAGCSTACPRTFVPMPTGAPA